MARRNTLPRDDRWNPNRPLGPSPFDRTGKLIIVVGLILAALIVWHDQAGGQIIPPQPAAITDYAGYPANNGLPAGCDANDVTGVTYSVNAGPPAFDLQGIGQIKAGDVLTMTWRDVAAECAPDPVNPAPIVLAMKSAPGPVFDPSVDQALDLPYALGWMTAGQGGTVSYVLPDLLDDSFAGCFGQLDAIVGLPLAVVGPGGSFYSSGVPWDMLISAWNGGYEPCEAPPTTTTSTPETTTTTTPATSTTIAPPPTTTTLSPLTTAMTTNPCWPNSDTLAAAAAGCALNISGSQLVAAPAPQLPVTGSSGWLIPLGLLVVAAGVLIFAATRKAGRSS